MTSRRAFAKPAACEHDMLKLAIRQLRVEHKRRKQPKSVNSAAIEQQVERMRTALAHLKNIKTLATKITSSVGEINEAADELRDEVSDALAKIEAALSSVV